MIICSSGLATDHSTNFDIYEKLISKDIEISKLNGPQYMEHVKHLFKLYTPHSENNRLMDRCTIEYNDIKNCIYDHCGRVAFLNAAGEKFTGGNGIDKIFHEQMYTCSKTEISNETLNQIKNPSNAGLNQIQIDGLFTKDKTFSDTSIVISRMFRDTPQYYEQYDITPNATEYENTNRFIIHAVAYKTYISNVIEKLIHHKYWDEFKIEQFKRDFRETFLERNEGNEYLNNYILYCSVFELCQLNNINELYLTALGIGLFSRDLNKMTYCAIYAYRTMWLKYTPLISHFIIYNGDTSANSAANSSANSVTTPPPKKIMACYLYWFQYLFSSTIS